MMKKNEILERTLITGSKGLVGSYLDFGIKTDRSELDVTDFSQVMEICTKYKPKVILHLAVNHDQTWCEANPMQAFWTNGVGTYHMAMAAKQIGAKMVYISTATVFNGYHPIPYCEEDEPNPQNTYARSKYIGEVMVRALVPEYLILRTGWLFGGCSAQGKLLVTKILNQLHQPEMTFVSNHVGTLTYAKDFALSLGALIQEDKKGIFHIVAQGFCSPSAIAQAIVEITKAKAKVVPIRYEDFRPGIPRGLNERLVSSKIKSLRPWQEGLREYITEELNGPFFADAMI